MACGAAGSADPGRLNRRRDVEKEVKTHERECLLCETKSPAELHARAARLMREAREASRLLVEAGLIRRPPDGSKPCPGEAARRASG
jgi:hypothetical protein